VWRRNNYGGLKSREGPRRHNSTPTRRLILGSNWDHGPVVRPRRSRGPAPGRRFATFDPVDATVESRRKDVIIALREASAASEDLKGMFDNLDIVTREAVDKVKQGSTALELAESMRLADRRENLNAAADRMRKSRHEFQRAMFLLALAEGSSRAEIARVWRVSRQLVSRMAGEHLEDDV
jgi:hypothetical protein